MWSIMGFNHGNLLRLKRIIESKNTDPERLNLFAKDMWHSLCAMSWSYEEMCREWFLPTDLAITCSTPNEITLAKNPILPIRAGCVSYAYLKKSNTKKSLTKHFSGRRDRKRR